jgi:hypothetical protein
VSTNTFTSPPACASSQRAIALRRGYDLVIIVALRVDRDRAAPVPLEDRERIAAGAVVQSQHDHGADPRHQRTRIAAPVAFHPVHVAERALGEKACKALSRLRRDGVRPSHADDVESVLACELAERGL